MGQPLAMAADSADAVFAAERARYLERLQERYRRVDLEVLTPLAEQSEQPQMLLGSGSCTEPSSNTSLPPTSATASPLMTSPQKICPESSPGTGPTLPGTRSWS